MAGPLTEVHGTGGVPRRLVLLFAVAGGAAVATNYYVQPLLVTLGRVFGTSETTTGLLVTAGQIGYAAGLILIVPLGDLLDRRRLICTTMTLSAVALTACALAPSLVVLGAALATAGLTTVAAQILVPLANDLAAPAERGRIVSMVVSGLLIGILVARVFSGVVSDLAGWRAVYASAAVIVLVLMVALYRMIPDLPPRRHTTSYPALLRSIATLIGDEPVLRRRMLFGALGSATFIVFWTDLTFLLSGPPFHYSDALIGLVGLVGVVGALASQAGGRLFDRGLDLPVLGACWVLAVVAWAVCALGATSIAVILLGVLVLDAAVQGQHMLNQSTILGLAPAARSRANTAYVVSVWVGAALAASAAAAAWSAGGWTATCALGGGLAVAGVALWVVQVLRPPAAGPTGRESIDR